MSTERCISQIDWSATGAMAQGLGTLLGAITVLVAAIIGANTFSKWRKQKLAERRIEQAERILTATYKVRRRLSFVRSPAMWANEIDSAEARLKENGAWDSAVGKLEQKKLTTAQAYYSRIGAAKADREALDECLPMARALFGETLEQALEKLNRQFWTVQVFVDANLRDRGNGDQAFRSKIDGAIWEGYPSTEENEVDQEIKEQVHIIESVCVPVLRLEEPKSGDAKSRKSNSPAPSATPR